MKLLTEGVARTIPMLYTQETKSETDAVVKFFLPGTAWTWYVVEGATVHAGCTGFGCDEGAHTPLTEWKQGEDALFFGYVVGLEPELGYFTLHELEQLRVGPFRVERDLYWTPQTVASLMEGANG